MTLPGWEGAVSGLSYKLFPALGAGDGDLALAPGYPDTLPAAGAIEIPVLPILEPVDQQQKPPIFPVTPVGVPGQHPENAPAPQGVVHGHQNQLYRGVGDKQADDHQDHRRPQQKAV